VAPRISPRHRPTSLEVALSNSHAKNIILAPEFGIIGAHQEGIALYQSEPDLDWFHLEALSVYRFGNPAEREAFVVGYRGAQRRVKQA
jgi:hypothetical protein